MWTRPKTADQRSVFGQVYCSYLSYMAKEKIIFRSVVPQFLYVVYINVIVNLKLHCCVKAFRQFNTCRLSAAAEEP